MQRNGRQRAHVRARVKKAAAILGQIWKIGKRRFGGDWEKRLWLFDKLVWMVLSYGAEIWRWDLSLPFWKGMEERYLR